MFRARFAVAACVLRFAAAVVASADAPPPPEDNARHAPFGLNANFVEIDMRFEGLTAIPNATLLNPHTKVLVLASNDIARTADELRSLSALEMLDVSRNRLRTLSFLPDPCSLRVLDVSENVIVELQGPLQKCEELELLNLTRNELSYIRGELFTNMGTLKSLYLSYNKLRTLPRDVFAKLVKLEDLYLNGNQLRELPEGLFVGLHSLKRLWMNGNQLRTLPVLEDCCEQLKWALFNNNDIATPSAVALRALLAGDAGINVGVYNNPVRPTALRWALAADDIQSVVDDANCACGRLRRGSATVYVCVATACGVGAEVEDWIAAVRAASVVP